MKILAVCFIPCLNIVQVLSGKIKTSCGIDNSPINVVYEGFASIETYPWLGILYYPYLDKRFTSAVVLVTRQIVLGAATEIDQLPKKDFRKRARVVLGHNCSGPSIGIRDYTYHPEYAKKTYSALAILQLEVDLVTFELRPVCAPPAHFADPKFYAMALSNDCRESTIKIYKMQYVPAEECQAFYRRSGLDVDSMWPSHTACARSLIKGQCLWRSGAILVLKYGRRWRLLGFGVYGPGCEAPARFLDYGMYHKWVRDTVARMGKPAISTIDLNHIIMRKTLSSVQRFGPCDPGETEREIYSDTTSVIRDGHNVNTYLYYNISLYADMEYSCIVFKADYENVHSMGKPKISLRRWCAGANKMCSGFQFLEIHFYLEIVFSYSVTYSVRAYGGEAKVIDVFSAIRYINRSTMRIRAPTYDEITQFLEASINNRTTYWFYKRDY